MKIHASILTAAFVYSFVCANAIQAQEVPFVYDVENSGAMLKTTLSPSNPTTDLQTLPNPFVFANGKKQVRKFKDWERRRNEILQLLQRHEIGEKPVVPMDSIDARMDGDTLHVCVHANGQVLEIVAPIRYPQPAEGQEQTKQPPYPLMIGSSMISLPRDIFEGRPIATLNYREAQVNNYSQFGHHPSGRGNYAFDRLYPHLSENGAYSEWAWGFSRLLDGLQKLGPDITRIDMRHIGVTGCSYAGKMALYCGALDERVALTIAQEPGGGGAAAWRVSRTLGNVESLDRTDYNWFKKSMRQQFGGDSVRYLPIDHHELVALCCPRAVLLLGNPDYEWLADPSMYVSANASRKVWTRFGIDDRMGYSIVAGHGHCQLPREQYPEVEAFIDRFLLEKDYVSTSVSIAPADYASRYDWETWSPW